jgi:hypothetical protein
VRGEIVGADAREHAAVPAYRGADRVEDDGVGHGAGAYTRGVDEFGVFVLFGFIVAIGIFLAIGRWYPGSGAEQVDWRLTRSPEVEAELELDDVDQMLEAQNARRRASGRAERTEDDIRAQVAEDERWRAELRRRARGD